MTKKTSKPSGDQSVENITDEKVDLQEGPDTVDDAEVIVDDVPAIEEEPSVVEEDQIGVQDDTTSVQEAPKSSVVPMIFGGAVAAVLGFGASAMMEPKSWPFGGNDGALGELQRQQGQVIQSLEDKIAEMSSEVALRASVQDIETSVDPIQSAIADIEGSIDQLGGRLAALESLPAANGDGGNQTSLLAFEAEMQSLRTLVNDQKSALQAAADEAVATQQSAEDALRAEAARAALGRIQIAGDTGQPFQEALIDFEANSDVEMSNVLNDVAATGIPKLSDIQADFPKNARLALASSRSEGEQPASTAGRLSAFFKAQTGARSVTPREGSDADAVLSRVEAAVKSGNLTDAMAELEILPEVGRAAMSEWTAQVTTRQEALKAIDALSAALASN